MDIFIARQGIYDKNGKVVAYDYYIEILWKIVIIH